MRFELEKSRGTECGRVSGLWLFGGEGIELCGWRHLGEDRHRDSITAQHGVLGAQRPEKDAGSQEPIQETVAPSFPLLVYLHLWCRLFEHLREVCTAWWILPARAIIYRNCSITWSLFLVTEHGFVQFQLWFKGEELYKETYQRVCPLLGNVWVRFISVTPK